MRAHAKKTARTLSRSTCIITTLLRSMCMSKSTWPAGKCTYATPPHGTARVPHALHTNPACPKCAPCTIYSPPPPRAPHVCAACVSRACVRPDLSHFRRGRLLQQKVPHANERAHAELERFWRISRHDTRGWTRTTMAGGLL